MRETYVKPMFYYESFGLTQSIAKACALSHPENKTLGESNHYNENTCTWDMNGVNLFVMGVNDACSFGPAEDEKDIFSFMGLCYNNPDGQGGLFSSM